MSGRLTGHGMGERVAALRAAAPPLGAVLDEVDVMLGGDPFQEGRHAAALVGHLELLVGRGEAGRAVVWPAARTRVEYVAEAAGEAEAPSSAEAAIEFELECLWHRLGHAVGYAANGVWSLDCDGLVRSIVALSKVVGALRWGAVPMTVVAGGLYEEVYQAAGISYPPVDWVELREAMAS